MSYKNCREIVLLNCWWQKRFCPSDHGQYCYSYSVSSYLDMISKKIIKWAATMTKLTYCVCEQHGSRPACTSDQDPCCSLLVSLLVKGFVREQHGSWSDCADVQAGVTNALCWFLSWRGSNGVVQTERWTRQF
jgi:hypothetical protein